MSHVAITISGLIFRAGEALRAPSPSTEDRIFHQLNRSLHNCEIQFHISRNSRAIVLDTGDGEQQTSIMRENERRNGERNGKKQTENAPRTSVAHYSRPSRLRLKYTKTK